MTHYNTVFKLNMPKQYSTSPNSTNLFSTHYEIYCKYWLYWIWNSSNRDWDKTPSFSLGLGVWLLGNSNGCSIDTTASNDHEWCLHSLKDSSNVDLFKPLASVTWCSVIHRRCNTVVVYVLWCCIPCHVFMFWTVGWLQKAIMAFDDTNQQ